MSMSISRKDTDNLIRIRIGERFDYASHNEFRSAYKDAPANTEFVIDMTGTTYMDSSALGMLLLLREHAGSDSSRVSITGCKPEIKKILEISNFHMLFNIT